MEKIECPKCNSIMQEFDIKPKKPQNTRIVSGVVYSVKSEHQMPR